MPKTSKCFISAASIFSTIVCVAHTSESRAGNLSATISLVSDYVFRGVSFTDGPAIQGSIDYGFDSGFYLGIWTSNYDFDTAAKQELDYYGGYSRSLNEQVSISAGASRYTFISEHEIDYNEFHIGLVLWQFEPKIWYAVNYGGSGGDAQYYELGYKISLPKEFSVGLRAGYSAFDSQIGINDYSDYMLNVEKSFGRFDTEIRVTDTNENQYGDREGVRVIASISTTFN